MLTQWQQELEMLENWLNNPEPEGGFQAILMQIGEEYQHEEQLDEFGVVPA
jgi:hypothetical protein